MKDAVSIGVPYMDALMHIDKLPTKKDEEAFIQKTSWQGGGKTATGLVALAQLGGTGAYIGVAGDDSYGRFLARDFERYGIDVSHLIHEGKNAFTLALSDQATHGRNLIRILPTPRQYDAIGLDPDFLKGHKVLMLEAANDVTRRAADIIHEARGLVEYDGDMYDEATQAMLDKIDIFIGSEFYYQHLFGESGEYEENLAKVSALGPRITIFTFGEKGCAVYCEGRYEWIDAYPITPIVDTVGAGDVFHGAYVYAITHDQDPFEAARFASAVSAIKCTSIGGRSGIPDLAMVKDFMKTGTFDRGLLEEKVKRYENFGE